MARTNMTATRVKPTDSGLIQLQVLRREQPSPTFVRVTLGGGDIGRFTPMGYDQWFRLFIPVDGGAALARLPQKLDTVSYVKYLAMAKVVRPVLRNYTVRTYRPDGPQGPELDVDFVLHGSVADGTAGPAASWAQDCAPGDPVAILDEGISFHPDPDLRHFELVADETGLPAVAGILASLESHQSVRALIEVPTVEDRFDLPSQADADVIWLVREPGLKPGSVALETVRRSQPPAEPWFGWVVGESGMATEVRRHWVASGQPKERIMFCGYWKHTHKHR